MSLQKFVEAIELPLEEYLNRDSYEELEKMITKMDNEKLISLFSK